MKLCVGVTLLFWKNTLKTNLKQIEMMVLRLADKKLNIISMQLRERWRKGNGHAVETAEAKEVMSTEK